MAKTNIKYLKENNLYEAHKHFMQLAEVSYGRPFPEMLHGVVMDEEGEDNPNAAGQDPNAMAGAPGGDPNAAGGMPPGGDPNAMGGAPGGDPMAGGDPNAQMGADPNAMGQPMPDAAAPIGPDTGEDPFADQRGDDAGGEDQLAGEGDGNTIDIDGLTAAQQRLDVKQNQVGRDLATVDNRIIKLIDTIKGFQDKLDQNNTELENLKAEFEKRNPTQTEKLDLRGVRDSFPFNVTPDGFWANKLKERDNYEIYGDNSKSTEDQYTITSDDLEDTSDEIAKTFSVVDDDIQTLDKLFKL
jgi:hypothetical protein